jgi:hypothetical protein
VAKHVKVDTFDALSKCQAQILKMELEKHNDVLVKEEVQRELDLLLRLSEQEKKVRYARKKIEDELLVLSCPHCNKSFTEWSACGALECYDDAGNGCRTKFCCYCQENLTARGVEPHSHVRDCPVAGPMPRGVDSKLYPPKWFLDQVWASERKRKVTEFIATLEAVVRVEVMQLCRQSFRDLGISFEDSEGVSDFDEDIALGR